jgi:cell division protein FtsI (penicillin-binding protein 3)
MNKPSPAARSSRSRAKTAAASVSYATSPLLASKTPPWRSRFVVFMVGAGFTVLIGRAVYVQIIGNEFYLKQGEMRYAHTIDVPASRGNLVDRNGLILATSVAVPSIFAVPKELAADDEQRRALAKALGTPAKELADRLDGNPNFAWLARQVDESVAERVKALKIKGIYEQHEYRRKYPEGESAAHVVGFTNIEDKGQEGVELTFQQQLVGRDGSRGVVRDRFGRVVEDIGEPLDPRQGSDIQLAIDSKIQFYAYQRLRDAVREHKAKAGSVVVLDAKSGEVLALANYPSYDPNARQNLSGQQLRNRAVTDTFEPGSTMKPFIAAWAMETGRVTPNTMINTTPGRMTIGGSTISDTHPHGVISVAEVIQKSSNVGTVKMAMQMQPREMWELFSHVGFGQRPQIEFPGTVSGRLRPFKSWRPIEQATMSYGYGLSVSLFQLARAYTVFAHDGELMPMSIVKQTQPPVGSRVITAETALAVRQMLHMAAGPGGTAPLAQAIGYSVGGKTGTARKQEGKSYLTNKYRAWFVGMAPIGDPRIVVAVMVDEPSNGKYFGGLVAAPVFSQVVPQTLRMLGVPPDIEVKPQIVTDPAVEESF